MKKLLGLLVLVAVVYADGFEIVIDRGNDQVSMIAVVPFKTPAGVEDLTPIVEFDMARSGQFAPMDAENMLSFPATPEEVNFRDWKVQGAQYVLIGDVQSNDASNLSVTFHVFDVALERRIHGGIISGTRNQHREIAHRVADEAFEAITQVPGAFSTKIMYVLVQGRGTEFPSYRLQISDSDGANVRTVLESALPIMSPVWAPDGKSVCYVSFETGRSTVILHELATGNRQTIAAFEGTNSAPTFSPDGNFLALTLSRDGNPEIYTVRLRDLRFRRITSHRGIDTEPIWSTDGSSILFTSNRSGDPQLYLVKLNSLSPQRLTFEGDYNARARVLPGGSHMLYVHRSADGYHIVWQSIGSEGDLRVLTSNVLDESPSIAPNGMLVVFATRERNRGILGIVSVDGQVALKLPSEEGDVQEPAWSPFMSTTLTMRDI